MHKTKLDCRIHPFEAGMAVAPYRKWFNKLLETGELEVATVIEGSSTKNIVPFNTFGISAEQLANRGIDPYEVRGCMLLVMHTGCILSIVANRGGNEYSTNLRNRIDNYDDNFLRLLDKEDFEITVDLINEGLALIEEVRKNYLKSTYRTISETKQLSGQAITGNTLDIEKLYETCLNYYGIKVVYE